MPRWPPASKPMAMIASQPHSSSQRASATVVADDMILAPVAFTRSSNVASGRPKLKLTTSGRKSSTSAQNSASNGARFDAGIGASGSSLVRHSRRQPRPPCAIERMGSCCAGVAEKLRLIGREVPCGSSRPLPRLRLACKGHRGAIQTAGLADGYAISGVEAPAMGA